MIIDAGIGDKMDAKSVDIYGIDRARHLDHALADAGLDRRRHRHRARHRTCISITPAASRRATQRARCVPRFPRARYVVRHGEWEDATHPHERNRASYLPENFVPLRRPASLDLVDGDGDDHAGRPRACAPAATRCTTRS